MRHSWVYTFITVWLGLFVCGCSQNPSGGKRLASEKALDAVADAYKERDNKTLFLDASRIAKGSITMAERTGDPSRKADVQLSIDLDMCRGALATYEQSLEADTSTPKDQLEILRGALPRCIDVLRKDLQQ